MKKIIAVCLGCVLALGVVADAQPADRAQSPSYALDPNLGIATEPLWTGAVPDAKGHGPLDTPTLTVFVPHPGRGIGTAIVIAPGGAYLGLAANLEGRQVADWFAARGVTAFVLRYRLGARYLYPIPLEDAQRAIRWVRYYAALYQISPDRIGMAGFSAGGHLAAMTGTVGAPGNPDAADPIDRMSSRPDFLVLGYPWLNAMEPDRPKFIPSYQTLMKIAEPERKSFEKKYTPATLVTATTPPTFIYATTDDSVVPVDASVGFYSALIKAGVSAELHLFRHGGHGSGLGQDDPSLDQWPNLLLTWLGGQDLLTPGPDIAAAVQAAYHRTARKPGEPFTLDSHLGDVLRDAAARAVLVQQVGNDFLENLPEAARSASLRTVLGYRQPPLSAPDVEALNAALAKAGER